MELVRGELKMDKTKSLADIKKELAEELKFNLKKCNETILKDLVSNGYSSFEMVQMLAKPESASGLDLINSNRIVEKTFSR